VSAATFASAATAFARLVHDIPASKWDGPGLGEWDLRSLVGHTSRSLVTVSTYLQTTADSEDLATPQEYYARVNPSALGIDSSAIVERGRQAGIDLGLWLVGQIAGEAKAKAIQLGIEYDPQPPFDSGHMSKASVATKAAAAALFSKELITPTLLKHTTLLLWEQAIRRARGRGKKRQPVATR